MPTPQDVWKKGSEIPRITSFAVCLH